MARIQGKVLLAAAAAFALLFWATAGQGWRMAILLVLGLAFGATLYGTAFGFTAAYRDLLVRRDAAAVCAQLVMLVVATVLFAPLLAAGAAFGYGVTGAVAPVGVSVAVGALMFGAGMQLAGGCGSGALYTAGGGSVRMLLVLAAFCAGSFWASLHMGWWQHLPAWDAPALGEALGWPAAVALQLALLAVLWTALRRVMPVNRAANPVRAPSRYRLLLLGAVLLAVLNFLTLIVAGHPWSITWAFALWGAKGALFLGWTPGPTGFWAGDFQSAALAGSVIADVTSVMDIGIVLGALAAAALAGRFRPALSVSLRMSVAALIGGLAMGYGARIAYGCNIGAFFSGVASTSLHGWLWIAAAFAGTAIGVRLRPKFGMEN
jgi:uncharacterized protein